MPITTYKRPPDAPIRVELSWRGGTEFNFPAARNHGVAVGLTIFLALWSGAIVALLLFKAPIFFPIMLGLFDLIILVVVFDLWFGSACVTVSRDTVTVTRTMRGWQRERVVPVTDIKEFQATIGLEVGTTTYYDIKIVLRSGKRYTIASSIKDIREADWLAAEMARCAGIDNSQ
jgi:hypothetical protein